MKPTVFLDIDGVLLDFVRGLFEWAARKKLLTQKGREILTASGTAEPTTWGMDDCFIGGFAAMHDFYHSNEYAYLKPLVRRHFLEGIKAAGADIVLITAAPADPKLARSRILNVALHFGNVFDEVIFTGDCKLQRMHNHRASVFAFVEDKPSTLVAAHEGAPVSHVSSTRWKVPVLGITHKYNQHLIEEFPDLPMFMNTEWACTHIIESLVREDDQAGLIKQS